jgi:glycosyltransferase involved in cell wall biosynthesis
MRISIVICTHNRPELLSRALNSIIAQKSSSLKEIIVVNDGSEKSYQHILSEYVNYIAYYEYAKSRGVSFARNYGIEKSSGEWILFLDDDDELAHGYIDELNEQIIKNPGFGFFWSEIVTVYSTKNNGSISVHRKWPKNYSGREDLYFNALSIGASFGLAVNSMLFEEHGGFDTSFPVGEDVEFVAKLLNNGVIPKSINQVGVYKYENHSDRLSASIDRYSKGKTYERILEKYKLFFNEYGDCKRGILYWSANCHAVCSNYKLEISNLRELWHCGFKLDCFRYLMGRLVLGKGFVIKQLKNRV